MYRSQSTRPTNNPATRWSTVSHSLIYSSDNPDNSDSPNYQLHPSSSSTSSSSSSSSPSSTPDFRPRQSSTHSDHSNYNNLITGSKFLSDLTASVTSPVRSPSGPVGPSPLQPRPGSTSPEKSVPLSPSPSLQPSFDSRSSDFTTAQPPISSLPDSSQGIRSKSISSSSSKDNGDLKTNNDHDIVLASLSASSVTSWDNLEFSSKSLDKSDKISKSLPESSIVLPATTYFVITPSPATSNSDNSTRSSLIINDSIELFQSNSSSELDKPTHSILSSRTFPLNQESSVFQSSVSSESDSVIDSVLNGYSYSSVNYYSSIGLYSSGGIQNTSITESFDELLVHSTPVPDKYESIYSTSLGSDSDTHFLASNILESSAFPNPFANNNLTTVLSTPAVFTQNVVLNASLSQPVLHDLQSSINNETDILSVINSDSVYSDLKTIYSSSWDTIPDSVSEFPADLKTVSFDGSNTFPDALQSSVPSVLSVPYHVTDSTLFTYVVSSLKETSPHSLPLVTSHTTTQLDIDSSYSSFVDFTTLTPASTGFKDYISLYHIDSVSSRFPPTPISLTNYDTVRNTDQLLTTHNEEIYLTALPVSTITQGADSTPAMPPSPTDSVPAQILFTADTFTPPMADASISATGTLEGSNLTPTKVLSSSEDAGTPSSVMEKNDASSLAAGPIFDDETNTQPTGISPASSTLSPAPPSSSTTPTASIPSSSTATDTRLTKSPVQQTATLSPENNVKSKSSESDHSSIIKPSFASPSSSSLSSSPSSPSSSSSSISSLSSQTLPSTQPLSPSASIISSPSSGITTAPISSFTLPTPQPSPSSSLSASTSSSSSMTNIPSKTPDIPITPPYNHPDSSSKPSSSWSPSSSSYHHDDTITTTPVFPSASTTQTITLSPTSNTPTMGYTHSTSSRSNTTSTITGTMDSGSSEGFMAGSGPIIIGSACGALAVLIVIIIAVICAMRKRKRKRNKSNGTENAGDDLWVDMSGRDQRYKLPSPSLMTLASLEEESFGPDKNENDLFYKAIHDYTALQEGHLNLSKGDRVQLLETADGGWCRGISKKDGMSGWFPNSYVVEAQSSDKDIKARHASREASPQKIPPVQVSSFQIKKTENQYATPVVFDTVPSYASLERKQGTNDVASWVKMASSISMSSIPSVDSATTRSAAMEDYNNPTMKDRPFCVVYAYKATCKGEMSLREGELVVCREKDKNGWMLGFKPQTKEEGWFPAVYVDEVPGQADLLDYTNVPFTYEILENNKLHNTSQVWTGIEHKAVSEYSSDVPGDLAFTLGDVIIVYQTLANGWWFGERGDKSGWFPGSFVEMTPTEDSSGAASSSTHLSYGNTSRPSTPYRNSPSLDDVGIVLRQKSPEDNAVSASSPLNSVVNSPRESIASSIYSENDKLPLMTHKPKGNGNSKNIRPNRKAPAPPPVMALKAKLANNQNADGTNSLRRPARPAPAPPKAKDIEKSQSNHQQIHASSDTLNDYDEKKPKKPVVLIHGKIPKLVKAMPSAFDDKCLNPMMRPAKRGFAPTPDQYREEKTKHKRTSLASNPTYHTPDSCRNSFIGDYSIPHPISPLNLAKKTHYMDNHGLTKASPTPSVDSGMDVKMQRPYTPTHPSPLVRSFNEFDRNGVEPSVPSLHRSNTSTPTAFHRLSPRNSKNLNNRLSPHHHNHSRIPSPSHSSNNGYATPSINIVDHVNNHHDDSISTIDLGTVLTQESTDDPQEFPSTVSTFLSPHQHESRYKGNKSTSPRPGPKTSPRPGPKTSPKPIPSPRASPKPDKLNIPKSVTPTPSINNNNNVMECESDKLSPEISQLNKDPTPENTFRPINDGKQSENDLSGLKLLRYSDGTELDHSNSTSDSLNDLSPSSQELSLVPPVFKETVSEETTTAL